MRYDVFDNDNFVSVNLFESAESLGIIAWLEENAGSSWYSPKPGPKRWKASTVPYAANELGLMYELTVQFDRAEDATLFALKWVR